MKSLSLLNDDTTIKLGDTGTMVQFTATNNEAPVQLTGNQTAQFRLKNDFGLVKTITATTTYNGLIFQFDTADLKGLVQGTYQVELAVNVDKDNTLIFPDDGFVSFTLSANALNITGQQLNLISLDDFKEQIKAYVQQETQGLKDDFSDYVASVKQGPQGEQGPTGPQGPKGDKGDSSTLSLGTTDIYKPWVFYDSFGKQYSKCWLNANGVESSSNSDVTTDYFECPSNCTIVINTPSLDLTRFVTTAGGPLRISFYDSNKNHIKQINFGSDYPTPGQVTTDSPSNTAYARISFNCCDSTTADGTNLRLQCISIGSNQISMSSNGNDKALNLNLGSSLPGIQGSQGPQGVEGPAGSMQDYVFSTGWLNFDNYMNRDVWCGWDSSNTNDIGYNRYAVTRINGVTILWIRVHSRFKTATTAGTWGTPLFYIPQDIVQQYGGGNMEVVQPQMYNCNNTLCASQVMGGTYTFNGQSFTRRVETRGAFQMQNNQSGQLPDSTQTVNYFCWYVI